MITGGPKPWSWSEEDRRQNAAEVLTARLESVLEGGRIAPSDLDMVTWAKVYGSTAGPFGGLGGQMMTRFQLTAYLFSSLGIAAVYCGAKLLFVSEKFEYEVRCPELDRRG